MNIKELKLKSPLYPERLRRIPSPPKKLYVAGADLTTLLCRPAVTIVGTRRMTVYGERVTAQLATELAEQGVVIVSGLALGVDALAHREALKAGGLCVAVLPGPLDNIVPHSHYRLAGQILEQGGALVSEYAPGDIPFRQNFIARNRIMSGLGDVLLVTEATDKSGTSHTARFAADQHKMVLAVPGDIYRPTSKGTNNLLKSQTAAPVTSVKDILNVLGLHDHVTNHRQVKGGNANEQTILDLMLQGISDGHDLFERAGLDISKFNQAITMLELNSKIRALGGNHWAIY